MHQIGGICDTLAFIGDSVLSRGTLHLFPQSSFGKGGWAPINGHGSGVNAWLVISETVADNLYDSAHIGTQTDPSSGNVYPADLQTNLTHELDHLHGNYHIRNPNGSENFVLTPNMRTCADFIW